MSTGHISATVTNEDLTFVLDTLEAIDARFPFLVSLSNEQRRRLFKAGASRAGAIPLAHQIATHFPQIFPASFPKAEMDKDVLLMAPLQTLRAEYASRASAIDDTLLALRTDNMKHVLEVYKYAKAAQDSTPGIKPLVEQLAVYFERKGASDADASEPAK